MQQLIKCTWYQNIHFDMLRWTLLSQWTLNEQVFSKVAYTSPKDPVWTIWILLLSPAYTGSCPVFRGSSLFRSSLKPQTLQQRSVWTGSLGLV